MKNNTLQKLVLGGAVALALVWSVAHLRQSPVDDPDWFVRLTLGLLLSFALLASKPPAGRRSRPGFFDQRPIGLPILALGAALLSVVGLIVPVRQFEWLGLVLLLYAAVRWALPTHYRWNILKAFFLFYWIHPLPAQIFGPFEMWMQRVSVLGSEWFLHIFNHRVWADGFVLRMVNAEFGVPQECSGMRTAVTVLLCTLGVGMLLRMRWYETLSFLAISMAQVLALNILRIGSIIHFATRAAREISPTVLHDTAGIFLLIAIALVQAEMVWWRSYSKKRREYLRAWAAGDANPPKRSSFLPPFWRLVVRFAAIAALVSVTLAAVAGVGYKRRAFHRATMIKGVIESLLHETPYHAERAAAAALELTPDDRELMTFKLRALVRGEKYEQALDFVEILDEPLSHMERAMQSASLAALGHIDEAAAILETLPEDVLKGHPSLSIFRAEYAARTDDPGTVAEYVRYAARSYLTIPRVRALYPYLARRDQWQVIADTHHPMPYQDIDQALLAVHANLSVNRTENAGRILRQATSQWPDEIRLLGNLAQFAARQPDSEWEERFEKRFSEHVDRLDPDRLASLIDDSFRMRRPDLAWKAWRQLETLDPNDPALFLSAARHAPNWFVFRRRQVGKSARSALETVDMRDTYRQRQRESGFAPHWERVPLADEMTRLPVEQLREMYIQRALSELRERDAANAMTVRLDRTYAVVLGMAGHTREARERLDAIAAIYPEMKSEVLLQHALNYERDADWQNAYEQLRQLMSRVAFPSLHARLMYVNTTLNMGMGQLALRTAMQAVSDFPRAPEAQIALAVCWEAFGLIEEALFILSRVPDIERMPLYAQLLHDAGRVQEARRVARVSGVSLRDRDADRPPPRVVPAEITVHPQIIATPSPEALRIAAQRASMLAEAAQSPFMATLREREADWFAAGGADETSRVAIWMDAGRDPVEAAAAAYNLAVLLMQQQRFDEAREAVEQGLHASSGCVGLWRLRVSLSDGDPEVAAEAHRRFPSISEFWLAVLVTRTPPDARASDRAGELQAWTLEKVTQAADAGQYSPGAMVRAADYLLRIELPEAAAVAARYAIDRGKGLETAYVVGLRSALNLGDTRWALSCALGGADHARNPQPFYQMLVNLNFVDGSLDRDMVAALQYLQKEFPQDTRWAEQLGLVHFRQGDSGRALSMLAPIVRADDIRGVRISSILLAAESARLENRPRHAVSILEAALHEYPNHPVLLNNLVYTLARQPDTRERAVALLPHLARLAGEQPELLDTMAVVYLEKGRLNRAAQLVETALERVDKRAYAYPYIKATHAEVLAARGDPRAGLQIFREIAANPDYPSQVKNEIQQRMDAVGRQSIVESLADARQYFRDGETERAQALLRDILRSPFATDDIIREARQLQSLR